MFQSVIIVVSFVVGLIVMFLLKNRELSRLEKENIQLKLDKDSLIEENKKLLVELQVQISANENSDERKKLLEDIQKLVKEDFTSIANRVIKEEQQDLRAQNKEVIEEKLKPLKEHFEQFKSKIEDFNKLEETNNATLKVQIENLIRESTNIKNTANDLCLAIRNNAQARGDFGEIILENLLSQAGLINKNDDEVKGNYITQHTFKDMTDSTARPRPDAVIYFPDNKHIIVDSKCPLNNFIDFTNSTDEEDKKTQLKLFYDSVNGMLDDLSEKYNYLEGLNLPEFKLMFIPLESCASYIYCNKELSEKATKKNIIIVCPSTLLATLKIINKTWQNKIQSENLSQILMSATSVYDKLRTFIERVENIDTKFVSLHKAFEDLFKCAKGRNGFIQQIANLETLGISPNKKIDEKYLLETDEVEV